MRVSTCASAMPVAVAVLILAACAHAPVPTSPVNASVTGTPITVPVPRKPFTPPDPALVRLGEKRPYADDSPWNKPIGPNPDYHQRSDEMIASLQSGFGMNPTMYCRPLYLVDERTPLKTVKLSGVYSNVTDNGAKLTKLDAATIQVAIPDGAVQAAGTDANIVCWNPRTGDEWGFISAGENADGTWSVRNGYHYNTNWSGVPPQGFASRGAGTPYLPGLVRPWEIRQGHIDHAIGFAYQSSSGDYVYPATKSDGRGSTIPGIPEGGRLQLDPKLTDKDFDQWGLDATGRIIARAMQKYGIICVNVGGHPKIYPEYEETAHWNGQVNADIVRNIPPTAFKVLAFPHEPLPSGKGIPPP